MKLLIVDDHRLVVEALAALLKKEFPAATVDCTFSAADASQAFRLRDWDVLLCDLNMDGRIQGFSVVTEALKIHPAIKVIMLSMHSERAFVRRALSVGAHAYVVKTEAPEKIFEAIHSVCAGQQYLSPSVATLDMSKDVVSPLTTRELEVALLVVQGDSSKDIAKRLTISVRTVEVHRRSLMNKLDVNNVAQLVSALSAQGRG